MMLPTQKEVRSTAFIVVWMGDVSDWFDLTLNGRTGEAYLLGVSGVIRAYPAVHQGDSCSDAIGKIVPDQQADLVLIRVGQESKKAATQDARQE